MIKRAFLIASASVMLFASAGCAAHAGYYSGYVSVPPPPPRREVIGVAPGPGFLWIDGYYGWRSGGGYYWVPGRWERPPRPHAHWAPGRWEKTHHGYAWHDGRWR